MPWPAFEGRITIAVATKANALMTDHQIYFHLSHEIRVYFIYPIHLHY
jgi:hypothetical protein